MVAMRSPTRAVNLNLYTATAIMIVVVSGAKTSAGTRDETAFLIRGCKPVGPVGNA
jgi:hypothetical protein